MPIESGQLVGPYEVLYSLGAGGMGEVFRARDTRLSRDVALKFLKEGHEERFVREARAISSLNHPYICALYDVGEHEGRSYLVMEYLEGKAAKGPIPPEDAVRIGIQIAEALDCAHRKGIIHRDLKPDNILLTATGVKILDFGLARIAPGLRTAAAPSTTVTLQLTAAHTMVGTPQYMAPEQLHGKPADPRSDIFALGCALYELLTGEEAFKGETFASVVAAVLERTPRPISELQPLCSPELDHIVAVALAKNPEDRWQSAGDVARMLQLALRPAHERTVPASAMTRRLAITAAGSLAVGALAGFFIGRRHEDHAHNLVASYLGGPPAALTPRVSPDGKFVAFVQVERNSTHLCVLRPETGDWSMLAEDGASGGTVDDLSWSADSTRIYFARYTDSPAGVYSVPALGGQQRLLLENARGAQALKDGSLLISRPTEQGYERLCRFWPETSKIREYDVATAAHWYCSVYRPFPNGKEAVVYGWPLNKNGTPEEERLCRLDLDSGQVQTIAKTRRIGIMRNNYPLAVMPGGNEVAVYEPGGDMERVMAYPKSGGRPRFLYAGVPPGSTSFDLFPDGSIVYDKPDRSGYLLRITPSAKRPDIVWMGLTQDQGYSVVAMNDGRYITAGQQSGRQQLMLLDVDSGMRPLVNTTEPTSMPCADLGNGKVALTMGADRKRRIVVVEVGSGRVTRTMFEVGTPVANMSFSSAAGMLYFTASNTVWRMGLDATAPDKVRAGEYVAAHPSGEGIVVFVHERFQPRLIWKSMPSGEEWEIPKAAGVSWANSPLGDRCIRDDGMMVCPTSPMGSWYFGLATVDLKARSVQAVDTEFIGDLYTPNWSKEGKIVAAGLDFRSSLLRLREDPS